MTDEERREPAAWIFRPTAAHSWFVTDDRHVAANRKESGWIVEPLYLAAEIERLTKELAVANQALETWTDELTARLKKAERERDELKQKLEGYNPPTTKQGFPDEDDDPRLIEKLAW